MSSVELFCPIFSVFIMLLIGAITIPTYVYPYFYGLDFEKTTCYINEINYPTTISSFDNYSDWERCDCGKRCTSYSPCIKLFTNSSQVIYDKFPRGRKFECTFHDDKCRNGEDIRNIETYLEESQNIYNEYINKTINCYIDTNINNIYIELNTSFTTTIISLCFMGLICIYCISSIIYVIVLMCRENRQNPQYQSSKKEISNPCYTV